MDSPERMPIACVHCAKAKAKCDKKVKHYTQIPGSQSKRRIQTRQIGCDPSAHALCSGRSAAARHSKRTEPKLTESVQVPCSRCVSKQIVCQSRATRRSSQAPSRRGSNLPRPHSERSLHASAAFHVSHFSSPPQDGTIMSPSKAQDNGENWHIVDQTQIILILMLCHPTGSHFRTLPTLCTWLMGCTDTI